MIEQVNVDKVLTKAAELCETAGSRFTDKRKNVLTVLLNSETPLSAYELSNQYVERFGDAVPPMSVYRMLEFLESNDLAHKLSSENKYIACSHIACDHLHEIPQFLICQECQKVQEIRIKTEIIEALGDAVKGAGYQLKKPQIELQCICDSCHTLLGDN